MRSRTAVILAGVAVAGCGGGRRSAAPAQAAGAVAQGARVSGPLAMVFDSLREPVALGVYRISLSMMLEPGSGRAAEQGAMQAVLDAERTADGSLAAIRVLGFMHPAAGRAPHPNGMPMIPFAILTWAPAGGWNAVSASDARGPHTTEALFVTDLPHHQPVPGAGAAR